MRRLWIAFIPALLVISSLAIGNPQHAHASAQGIQAPAAFRPFGWCDGQDPNTNSGSIKTKSVNLYGRLIEMRYDTVYRCAWGRISNGSPGDEVWIERSTKTGQDHKLGDTRINWGRDNYTLMFDDAGVVMQACGKAGNRVEIVCTPWY